MKEAMMGSGLKEAGYLHKYLTIEKSGAIAQCKQKQYGHDVSWIVKGHTSKAGLKGVGYLRRIGRALHHLAL